MSDRKPRKKGGRAAIVFCRLAGTAILLSVVLSCLPLTVPRFLGYEIYHVVSGSMEPEIPVGSVVYVRGAVPEDIQEGEVIAFWSGDSVIIHRVLKNKLVEGVFETKGDANAEEDMNDVAYEALVGRVERHYPVTGRLMVLYTSNMGKAYMVCYAACGAMFHLLAGRLKERRMLS